MALMAGARHALTLKSKGQRTSSPVDEFKLCALLTM